MEAKLDTMIVRQTQRVEAVQVRFFTQLDGDKYILINGKLRVKHVVKELQIGYVRKRGNAMLKEMQ